MSQILDRQIQRVLAPLVAGTNWGQKFVAERVLRIMNAYGEEFTWEKQGNEGLIDRGNQAKRSLNAPSNSVDPPENATATGKLTEYSLNSPIDLRLINAARVQDQIRSGIAPADGLSAVERLQLGRARMLQHNIQILKEKVVAGLVFGSGNFASGFTASDVGFGASGIIGKVLTAKRKVRQAFGFSPDVLVFGELAWLKLLENTDILDRIKYGGSNQDPA
ncbi:MAG TPA: hypothetical protein VMO47_09150, partial [Rhodothermales bacterium]|nr:hypothetical protein [Rhodothermales bacterium]